MAETTTLHAKKHYIVYAPGDVDRSMTIAAFYVAQAKSKDDYESRVPPSIEPMRRDVLNFLASSSAVNHWLNTENRLEKCPSDSSWLQLTKRGLAEIRASYTQSKNAASEEQVRRWIESMTDGGGLTEGCRSFEGPLEMTDSARGVRRTKDEALVVIGQYYKENRDRLPKGLDREVIIDKLMSGESPEQAFES